MVGFLGEVLGSDFNIAGFNWLSSPVAKELETLVMGWLAKALDMFDCFLFDICTIYELHENNNLPSFSSVKSAQDREQLLIDEVFVRVVVSIISSYARRFSKDGEFHGSKREQSMECLAASKGAGHVVLTNLEMGMDSIERLASDPPAFALS
ncbi:hypothetical protein J5N97_016771 [Dioscorea zingiberensis]|uniref:Putative E3 ubiquitin-protein ligase LIN N-terminal domain-containing protein n=1 Tax=Dioscorea zingiberensis TaxID=325984 RepID=A0A9D5HFH9_9LILI|nr:hypothetical protein J5N97_016771 [Dioscorea zingiberensis]